MSDIDTAAVDSLKALDPKRPIREADMCIGLWDVCFVPIADFAPQYKTSNSAAITGRFSHTCHSFHAASFPFWRYHILSCQRQRTPSEGVAPHSQVKREMQSASTRSRQCELRSQ